jgi:hypothetical protein
MTVLVTLIGAALIVAALADVFKTLFHPALHGTMSDRIAKAIWKICRTIANRYPKILTFAGPLALLCIIGDWVLLNFIGFALIYWPHASARPSDGPVFWGALVNSLEALSTLAEGGNAATPWLRVLSGIEAIIGFTIFTASISWLLSIYPIIESRRSVAHTATLLHQAEKETGVDMIIQASQEASTTMFSLAQELAILRNQIAQFPITHYFYIGEAKTVLAGILPYLADLADRAVNPAAPKNLHIPGTMLGGAVDDFLSFIAEVALDQPPASDRAEIMAAYADDQMCEPVSLAWRKEQKIRNVA